MKWLKSLIHIVRRESFWMYVGQDGSFEIDGLELFMTMYKAIAEAIFVIRDNEDGCWDASAGDAYSYASVLKNFDFILTLVVVRMVLGFARSATSQLQGQNIDVIKGLQEISTIKHSLQTARNSIDTYLNGWFDEAVAIANSVDAIVYFPRLCKRQTHRNNIPADDVSVYFKRNLTIPIVDHFLQELSTSFSEVNCNSYKALCIAPAMLLREYSTEEPTITQPSNLPSATTSNTGNSAEFSEKNGLTNKTSNEGKIIKIYRLDKMWKKDLQSFCEQYKEDMPSIENISHEVDTCESLWLNYPKDQSPSTISDTIKVANPVSFPNIVTALRILGTLPITSCTCERAASSVLLLKSYVRSTMTQKRLNGLALLYTHNDIDVPTNKVIDKFARSSRRVFMSNILDSDQDLPANDESMLSELY